VLAQTHLRISRYEARTEMAAHQHDEPSMGVVVSGVFLERIGNEERTYSRGTVSFCPAATVHSQQFGATGVRQIIFKPTSVWLEYLADSKARFDEAPHSHSAVFRNLGAKLLAEMRQDDGFSLIACEGIILEIIAAFARNSALGPTAARPPSWLRAAREYMHENACASLTMADIAREAGRHEIHVAREFRRFFGCSAGTYLRRLRIEEAERLLLKAPASIAEIAQNCGFASHSHLCREFKAHFGATPSEYRSRHC
jgi:AraC family transcriptional regulator